jgi:hypothetical protein
MFTRQNRLRTGLQHFLCAQVILLCLACSFAVGATATNALRYVEVKGTNVLYDCYINGFYISSRDGTVPIDYYLCSNSFNSVIFTNVQCSATSNLSIVVSDTLTITHVFDWSINLDQIVHVYETNFTLAATMLMPWEEASVIAPLELTEKAYLASIVSNYVDVLVEGNTNNIVQMLNMQYLKRIEAEALLNNTTAENIIDRFLAFYDAFWGTQVRGDVSKYDPDNLVISVSPFNDRVVVLKTSNDSPLVSIESTFSDIETDLGLKQFEIHAIMINNSWCLY